MRASHAVLAFLLSSVTLALGTACGGNVVIDGAGGSGGSIAKPTTATGQNPTTTTSTGVPTGNACEIAAAKIEKKLKACNITASSTSGSTGSAPCDAAAAKSATDVATCVEVATCDGLTGKDLMAAQAFTNCVGQAAGGGTTSGGTTGSSSGAGG